MRVAITGATGFLGGALAHALARRGADVVALSRPGSDRSGLRHAHLTWRECDVTSPRGLEHALEGADLVVHAAGRLGEAGVPEEAYRRLNVEGTRNVLAAALGSPAPPRVLHLSSAGVLGVTGRTAAPEEAPYAPRNPYERSKAESERVALEFARRGLQVVVARPGFVYGPGDRHVLGLFRAIQRGRFFYVGAGEHLCQPTFIDDAVDGILLCLRAGAAGGIYHVTGPRAVTFRELGDAVAAALGVRPPWLRLPRWAATLVAAGLEAAGAATRRKPPLSRAGVDFFGQDRLFSWRRAHDELGYTPRHDLGSGLPLAVAWYRERRLL
ncbi:NAD-dependent epimerase/dehydratase family protein [Anaeromyxobacter oryzisoli]|uniref:NAD-dependent epimerase/dehydratase family protein n=1 Tax=Anaeromyxobacter oryzisoli TaxID=2925408 RepID=UPI001F5AD5BF|nr:NAD-dependent epimerase/dehydratase family protein [Anaeromyxobacter sp. SG63]